MISGAFRDLIGSRGEKIVELCLTEFVDNSPLFWPAFLGDKWPAVDFYVELQKVPGKRLYFFVQTKATASASALSDSGLRISSKKEDIEHLLQIPGPTYLLGVHEPSRKVFAKSIHAGVPVKAVSKIPLTHELTRDNLKKLYDEVCCYWSTTLYKPASSVFS